MKRSFLQQEDILNAVANTQIIGFYSSTKSDHSGRYLHEIQQSGTHFTEAAPAENALTCESTVLAS